jgi:flagellar hook assembly protein FlgD
MRADNVIHAILRLAYSLVRTLKDEEMRLGNYQVIWDGKDDKGKEVASGIYFYKLTAGSCQKILKMVLLK